MQIVGFILGGIASIGILAGGIGYSIQLFMQGRKGDKKTDLETQNELTDYLKNQVEVYKGMANDYQVKYVESNKTHSKELAEMRTEISTFKAVINEKDQTIAKYLQILQNRNPDLEDTLKGIAETLSGINKFMQHIDTHLEKSTGDNMKISGTISKI